MPALSSLARPFVVGVVVEDDPGSVGRAIVSAAEEGCQAAEVNLTALPTPGTVPWSAEDLAPFAIPIYTSARRAAFMTAYGLPTAALPELDEASRMRWQAELLGRGSVALDLELDTFAPDPGPAPGSADAASLARRRGPAREFTSDARAVAEQRAVIADVHDRGGEVIGSCHTGTRQSADEIVAIAATAAERGADLVKVVAPCPTIDDLLELFRATARLVELGAAPFTLIGTGSCGSLTRYIGPHLGSGWTFARLPTGSWGFQEQPTASDLQQVFASIRWRYTEATA